MKKIIYNVTIKVNLDVHDEWLKWMKEVHVPDVLNTGMFLENKICRVLSQDESDGITYAFQYICPSMATLHKYEVQHAKALRDDVINRYKDKFVAFRTLMEIEEEFTK